MGRRTAVAAGMLVAAAALLVPAIPAAAKTTVTVKGDDVTITVPIDCAGCKGAKAPDGTDLAKYWEKTAEKAAQTLTELVGKLGQLGSKDGKPSELWAKVDFTWKLE